MLPIVQNNKFDKQTFPNSLKNNRAQLRALKNNDNENFSMNTYHWKQMIEVGSDTLQIILFKI